MPHKVSVFKQITREELSKRVKSVFNWSDLLRGFSLSTSSGNYRRIKAYVADLGIDTSHFRLTKPPKSGSKPKPLDEILVRNSRYQNTSCLKRRLLKEGLIENECHMCGQQPEHNGKTLVMVLDHINGISDDHRLENLRMVCPNCNSQLPTSYGRAR